jgi:hypothetical protein
MWKIGLSFTMPNTTLTLVVHADLSTRDAAQLSAVYRALRYPDSCITIAPAPYRVAA